MLAYYTLLPAPTTCIPSLYSCWNSTTRCVRCPVLGSSVRCLLFYLQEPHATCLQFTTCCLIGPACPSCYLWLLPGLLPGPWRWEPFCSTAFSTHLQFGPSLLGIFRSLVLLCMVPTLSTPAACLLVGWVSWAWKKGVSVPSLVLPVFLIVSGYHSYHTQTALQTCSWEVYKPADFPAYHTPRTEQGSAVSPRTAFRTRAFRDAHKRPLLT
jgi:hypothetical protein